MRLPTITLLILLTAAPLAAQTKNARCYADVSANIDGGVQNPVISAGCGFDRELSDTITFDADGSWRRTRKTLGGGYSLHGSMSLRIGKTYFGIGGVNVARQVTSLYNKTATNVFTGAGIRVTPTTILSGVYYLPDVTSPNRTQGFKAQSEIFTARHLYLSPHLAAFNQRCNVGLTNTLTGRCTSFEVGIGIGFYF